MAGNDACFGGSQMTTPTDQEPALRVAAWGPQDVRGLAKRLERLILEDSRRLVAKDPAATVETLLRLHEHARDMQQGLIAGKMYMSIRKLRDLLRAQGTSFTAIKEQVLRERCLRFIGQGIHNADDLTELLGYSDPSHFYQVFKRLMGRSFKDYLDRRKSP